MHDIGECFEYLHKFEKKSDIEQLMLPGLDKFLL
jgi:hypothetical protein